MDDAALLDRLARVTRGRAGAIALLTPDGERLLTYGCSTDADFEIGSVTKGVTGLLYVDALERGEVTADTRLADLLPLAGSAAGGIRLSDLATHRSGLPRVLGEDLLRRGLDLILIGTNPYAAPVTELYDCARTAKLRPGRARYSNAGFQLLGHALAAATRGAYPDLVRDRIAVPLGLAPWYLPQDPSQLLPGSLAGYSGNRERQPWTGASVAPAGGLRASIAAMARFARALLDGTAAGAAALDPVEEFAGPAVRIGAAWLTTDRRERGLLTWHNGGTGGFRSFLGLRREAGFGVVVLGASTRAVDGLAIAALDGLST